MSAGSNIVKVPIVGWIKNLSANSCESLGAAQHRALGHGLPPMEATQLGYRPHDGVFQQHEAGACEVAKVWRMLEIVVDGHGISGVSAI